MHWIFVAPALALACLLLMLFTRPEPLPNPPRIAPNTSAVLFDLPVVSDTQPPARLPQRARHLPKPKQFPTPAPLTDQERLFLALMRKPPNETRSVFAELQKPNSEPIQIEELHIEPLQSRGGE